MEKKPEIIGDDFVIKSDLKFGTSIAIDPPALEQESDPLNFDELEEQKEENDDPTRIRKVQP